MRKKLEQVAVEEPLGEQEEVPRSGFRIVRQGRAAHSWLRRQLTSQREVVFPLATEEVAGPLQFTRGGMFVWFMLGGQSWDFRTLDDRRRLWDQQTFRYGQLAASRPEGRPIRLRVSTRPYPSFEYARSLDEETPSPLPQVPGGESWNDYLGYGAEAAAVDRSGPEGRPLSGCGSARPRSRRSASSWCAARTPRAGRPCR